MRAQLPYIQVALSRGDYYNALHEFGVCHQNLFQTIKLKSYKLDLNVPSLSDLLQFQFQFIVQNYPTILSAADRRLCNFFT